LCCYFADGAYVDAVTTQVRAAYDQARSELPDTTPLRILFSAHGLPEKIVTGGDPYQHQIEGSVAAIMRRWGADVDHAICYQSRATPQKWIGPSTEEEIERAAKDKVGILVVPIAFVSDHSETLVELDIEYRHLAEKHGVPGYFRVPVPNDDPAFVGALSALVRRMHASGPGLCSATGGQQCQAAHTQCPHALAAA
jgi:ferrochelatase